MKNSIRFVLASLVLLAGAEASAGGVGKPGLPEETIPQFGNPARELIIKNQSDVTLACAVIRYDEGALQTHQWLLLDADREIKLSNIYFGYCRGLDDKRGFGGDNRFCVTGDDFRGLIQGSHSEKLCNEIGGTMMGRFLLFTGERVVWTLKVNPEEQVQQGVGQILPGKVEQFLPGQVGKY